MDACETLHQNQDLDTKCEFAILHTSTTWYCYKSLLLGDLAFFGIFKSLCLQDQNVSDCCYLLTFLLLLPVRIIDAAGLKERNQITCTQAPKSSLYISPMVSPFYGKEYGLWAGLGPVGSTENCPT